MTLALVGDPGSLPGSVPGSQPVTASTPASTSPAASIDKVPQPQTVQDPGPSNEPYRIHVGDQLFVEVFGDATLTQAITVLPGGDIFYPLVGRIHIDGLTPGDAAYRIRDVLRTYVRDPIVTVSVTAQGPIGVLVLGNVKNPGKYLIPATSRVSDALAAAGGLGPVDGDFPNARVGALNGTVQTVSLQKLLHDGDTSVDVRLSNGTTLYVPAPAVFIVEVLGSVEKQGDVTLHEGDTLAMAIAKAGATPNANPDLNHIEIKRTMPDGTTKTINANLYDVLKRGDLSKDVAMQKGDIVYVPQAKHPMLNGIFNALTSLLLIFK